MEIFPIDWNGCRRNGNIDVPADSLRRQTSIIETSC